MQSLRDAAEMADGRRAMSDFGWANGLLSRFDGLDPVVLMLA